jgi:hypothetical protein
MTEKTSKSDIVRDAIQKAISENFDFSSDSKKRELKEKINTENPNLFNKESLDSLFSKLLPKELIKAKRDPRDYGFKNKLPKLNSLNDMNANIQPEPQPEAPNTPATPTKDTTATAQATDQTTLKTEQDRSFTNNIDETSVSATFAALFIPLKIAYPEIDGLTEEEKKSLGKLWTPAFKKYLTEMQAIVILPLLATAAMLAPKIAKARKAKKEKQQKEKSESGEKKVD